MNATTFLRQNKEVGAYLLKFGVAFCLLYFGTLGVIGLSTPENQYSPFVARYLNFIDPLRDSLLYGAKGFLAFWGVKSFVNGRFVLALSDGSAVRMVYSCIGYGVMSFWAAFVFGQCGNGAAETCLDPGWPGAVVDDQRFADCVAAVGHEQAVVHAVGLGSPHLVQRGGLRRHLYADLFLPPHGKAKGSLARLGKQRRISGKPIHP